MPKIDLLRAWLTYNKPHVITLSETWLNNGISDKDIKLDDYVSFRKDRGSRGGGLLTYVASNLTADLAFPEESPQYFEGLFVNITFHENKSLIIGNIYKPPSAPAETTDCILSTINSLNRSTEKIILGDFNSNWLDRSSHKVRTLFNSINLSQIISEPTRVGPSSSSLLDWILVSHPGRITQSGVLPDSFSDHSMVFCVWKIKLVHPPPKLIKIRHINKINPEHFIQDILNVNWGRFQLIPTVEEAWHFFYSEFLQVINKNAPLISKKIRGQNLPWIKGELIGLLKQRDKAWGKFRKTRDSTDWNIYKELRNRCKTETRNAKASYFKNSLATDFKNPKNFWKKMNYLTNKSSKSSTTHISSNGQMVSEPVMIAEAFSHHFATIGQTMSGNSHYGPSLTQGRSNSSFCFNIVSPFDVQRVIDGMRAGCSAGPDGLDIRFFKLASHVLSFPLADLFNLSLTTGEIPSSWKSARVIPLHKGGSTSDMNNYRPISIINSVTKIFEKLIFNQLSTYLTDHNILSQHQSGFRPGYSTTTALLKFTNDVMSAADSNMPSGAIFIDLSKAFDLVDHYLLLDKLHAIGLSRTALLFFNSFLHNRTQSVFFQGRESKFKLIDKGVPQGSSLGPLLFSIFINDLPQMCSDSQIHLYADDTVLYYSSANISHIQHTLQSDFNKVQQWFLSNKLLLNKEKSYSMLFCTRTSSLPSTNWSVTLLDGTLLERVEEFKYLGVWLDSQLSFRHHINAISKKITGCLKSLYRSVDCFSQEVRKRIVTQLIFPILDYADVVYGNTPETHLHPLNVLYNSLCRFVLRCPYRTHHCTMYEALNWPAPKNRRKLHWSILIFKCIHTQSPPYLKELLTPLSSDYSLRNIDHLFLVTPRIRKEIGRRAFKFKAPSVWNSLPSSFRSITSLYIFRSSLITYFETSCSCF